MIKDFHFSLALAINLKRLINKLQHKLNQFNI